MEWAAPLDRQDSQEQTASATHFICAHFQETHSVSPLQETGESCVCVCGVWCVWCGGVCVWVGGCLCTCTVSFLNFYSFVQCNRIVPLLIYYFHTILWYFLTAPQDLKVPSVLKFTVYSLTNSASIMCWTRYSIKVQLMSQVLPLPRNALTTLLSHRWRACFDRASSVRIVKWPFTRSVPRSWATSVQGKSPLSVELTVASGVSPS